MGVGVGVGGRCKDRMPIGQASGDATQEMVSPDVIYYYRAERSGCAAHVRNCIGSFVLHPARGSQSVCFVRPSLLRSSRALPYPMPSIRSMPCHAGELSFSRVQARSRPPPLTSRSAPGPKTGDRAESLSKPFVLGVSKTLIEPHLRRAHMFIISPALVSP